jgi:hypothetical protein
MNSREARAAVFHRFFGVKYDDVCFRGADGWFEIISRI